MGAIRRHSQAFVGADGRAVEVVAEPPVELEAKTFHEREILRKPRGVLMRARVISWEPTGARENQRIFRGLS